MLSLVTAVRGYVGNTDYDWFSFLREIHPPVDEINFWRPGSEISFKALQPGEPFFFRLKAPHHAIGGFAFFSYFSKLPTRVAWDVYGPANGAGSYAAFRAKLISLRSEPVNGRDFQIGCILLTQPVFFDRAEWIRVPSDYAQSIQQGKTYDLNQGEGYRLWLECLARTPSENTNQQVIRDGSLEGGYGPAVMMRPRLGQRSFRVAVLDSYDRRCTVTGERTLPALEAAHIRKFSDVEEHAVPNGLLLRADLHRLFDAGYVTVTPHHIFEVSHRIKEEFENGRDYYRLHGSKIRPPSDPAKHPLPDALIWHNENRYFG